MSRFCTSSRWRRSFLVLGGGLYVFAIMTDEEEEVDPNFPPPPEVDEGQIEYLAFMAGGALLGAVAFLGSMVALGAIISL